MREFKIVIASDIETMRTLVDCLESKLPNQAKAIRDMLTSVQDAEFDFYGQYLRTTDDNAVGFTDGRVV